MSRDVYEYEDIQGAKVRNEGGDVETAQRDLRRIMAELGMSLHARTESSHEVVIREVLPRIRELRAEEPVRVDPGPHAHEWHEGQCLIVGCDAIDPADVKVGDVVEVSHDGPPPWRLEGTVIDRPAPSGLTLPPYDLWISFKPGGGLLMPRDATVRLVRRAEPDPEQVEALAEVLAIAGDVSTFVAFTDAVPTGRHWNRLARELVRRGVTVRGTDA